MAVQRVIVTLEAELLRDPEARQMAIRDIRQAGLIHGIDEALQDFGVLTGVAEPAEIERLRGLPTVASVDLDEEKSALGQGSGEPGMA